MSYAFMALMLVSLFGVIRPFKGFKRRHFGLAAVASFVLVGVTAPTPGEGDGNSVDRNPITLSPEEGAALEQRNASKIAPLLKEAKALPASEAERNLAIYKQLSALAPANDIYAKKMTEYQKKIAARALYEDNPEKALTIVDFDWGTGGFGSVMEITRLTLNNDAPFAIKDFKIHCVHQGNSGTDMDRNTRVLFEVVGANTEKTFRDINMGFISAQAKTSECEITSAVKA